MKIQLRVLLKENNLSTILNNGVSRTGFFGLLIGLLTIYSLLTEVYAQGTWTALAHPAPHPNGGVMLLLSDGTVMCKTASGSDSYGNLWDKLTPDIHGSYINGTWTTLPAMNYTRLFFSSQILMDGRVYVAGGEYGTGKKLAEVFNPLTNAWTKAPVPGHTFSDANSEILPDGTVLDALVEGSLTGTIIYNPASNTWTTGPTCLGIHNESMWVKLPDSSILFVNRLSTSSERYIPSLNKWIADATVPVALYDSYGDESGAGFLLPDGRAFFLGSPGHTAYYTPSGDTTNGTWTDGPDIPGAQGTPDAPGAMMVNGKILCSVSPVPTSANHFPSPTAFYEFNYLTNSFTLVNAPGGGTSLPISCYVTTMLDLPDGTVLFAQQQQDTTTSKQYYVYTPADTPLAAGKPTISTITQTGCTSFSITGTLFNGISEGAAYGDDWQMASNYPIVRLTSGTNVYCARTSNWNRTGVQTGSLADTAQFTTPAGLATGTYSLVVIANGISSDPVSFTLNPAPNLSSTLTPAALCSNTAFTYSPTSSTGGATFTWKRAAVTGISNAAITTPQSTNPNEVLVNTTTSAKSVIYTYTITVNGCSNIQNVTVVVNTLPATSTITAGGSTTFCNDGNVLLSGNTTGGTWSIAGGNTTTLTATTSGNYYVTNTNSFCGASSNQIVVTVNPLPSAIASSNSPVCAGGTLNLSATTISNATYSWSGPNGYSSKSQDSTISNVIAAMAGTYSVTATANGCTGATSTTSVTVNNCGITLSVKLFIQGYYQGGGLMTPALMNEGVSSNSNEVDTITLSLVDSATLNVIQIAKGVLQKNGALAVTFPGSTIGNNYYLKINQRNTTETWSRFTIPITSSPSYDFTINAGNAYGNNQTDVYNEGIWSIFSGDVNQDGGIDGSDFISIDADILAGSGGYRASDLNGDGGVDGSDFIVLYPNILLGLGSVHP